MKLHRELLDEGLVVGLPTAGGSPSHSESQPGHSESQHECRLSRTNCITTGAVCTHSTNARLQALQKWPHLATRWGADAPVVVVHCDWSAAKHAADTERPHTVHTRSVSQREALVQLRQHV